MDIKEIIEKSPAEMKNMLMKVYDYNSIFIETEEQKEYLKKIIFAMSVVDRKFFVDYDFYLDTALSIGQGQTISQPSTVARMLYLAKLEKGNKVLEVGAGSGWNASLISFLVFPGEVKSIDRILSLIDKAKENCENFKLYIEREKFKFLGEFSKINFQVGNFFREKGRYDRIIITAGIPDLETEQEVEKIAEGLLKDNGIMVCPHTYGPIVVYKKNKKLLKRSTNEEYMFVPLIK